MAGTLTRLSCGEFHDPPRRSVTPQCSSSGWPVATPPAWHLMATDGGQVAINLTSQVPLLDPSSVERLMVYVATTEPSAPLEPPPAIVGVWCTGSGSWYTGSGSNWVALP